jgi:hypothetical protein
MKMEGQGKREEDGWIEMDVGESYMLIMSPKTAQGRIRCTPILMQI